MNINNFKISTKLTLGFGLMAVLLFLISATSLWKAKNLHDDFESVMHQQYPKVVKIEEIKDLLNPESVTIPPAPSTAPINIPRCLPTAPPIDANDAQSQ